MGTKKVKYIDYFNSYTPLAKFEKKRSPIVVEFKTDDPERWFIEVIRYQRKSGKVSESYYIIKKDLDQWVEGLLREGFTISWKESNFLTNF